jgi:hypothetical protein
MASWFCSCGAENEINEKVCLFCGSSSAHAVPPEVGANSRLQRELKTGKEERWYQVRGGKATRIPLSTTKRRRRGPSKVSLRLFVGIIAIAGVIFILSREEVRQRKSHESQSASGAASAQTTIQKAPSGPPRGSAALTLPATVGQLRLLLSKDSYKWVVTVTKNKCPNNSELLSAFSQEIQAVAVSATIYCQEGSQPREGSPIAHIVIEAPFGGSLKGVHIGNTRQEALAILSDADVVKPKDSTRLTALIPKSGPPRFTIGLDFDATGRVESVSLSDDRYYYVY